MGLSEGVVVDWGMINPFLVVRTEEGHVFVDPVVNGGGDYLNQIRTRVLNGEQPLIEFRWEKGNATIIAPSGDYDGEGLRQSPSVGALVVQTRLTHRFTGICDMLGSNDSIKDKTDGNDYRAIFGVTGTDGVMIDTFLDDLFYPILHGRSTLPFVLNSDRVNLTLNGFERRYDRLMR
jgi:hypothetical protein